MENVYVIKHKEGGLHAYDVEMIVEENLLKGMPKDVVLDLWKFCNGHVISLSKEELVSWDSQWRITLVVNVLGEKVNFWTIEVKLQMRNEEREDSNHWYAWWILLSDFYQWGGL